MTEQQKINRVHVDSSQVTAVGYDIHNKKLEIEFKTGSVYVYENVEPEIHGAMMTAESLGKYFGQVIKADPVKYPFTKVEEPFSKRV